MNLAFRDVPPAWAVLPILAACLIAGIVLGAVHFGTLWRITRRFGGDGGALGAIVVMAGRFVVLGGALFLASLAGAAPLLTMAFGVLVARFAIVRRVRAIEP